MKKEIIKMVPIEDDGTPKFGAMPPPNCVADLTDDAVKALQSALSRRDKTGCADKVAVDAAKFVAASATAKDSDEYKKMLNSFKEMIMKSRKKEEVQGEDKSGTLSE